MKGQKRTRSGEGCDSSYCNGNGDYDLRFMNLGISDFVTEVVFTEKFEQYQRERESSPSAPARESFSKEVGSFSYTHAQSAEYISSTVAEKVYV